MTFPRFTKGNWGKMTFSVLNDVFDLLDWLANAKSRLDTLIRKAPIVTRAIFDAVILESRPITSTVPGAPAQNRWEYSWVEVLWSIEQKKWIDVEHGRSSNIDADEFYFAAYNKIEGANNGMDIEGLGVDMTGNPGVTIKMLPIPLGTPVTMTANLAFEGLTTYHFEEPNAYSIVCSAANG